MPYLYLHYLRLRFSVFPSTHCNCCNHGSDSLQLEVIDRLENLLRRSQNGRKRDWPRRLIKSPKTIKSQKFRKFIKSPWKKKSGEVKTPRKEVLSQNRDWSWRLVKSLRKKKGNEVETPLQERPSQKRNWPRKLIKSLRKKKIREVEIPL